MNPRRSQIALLVVLLSGVTVALGFLAWWTFAGVSFFAGLWLTRSKNFARPVVIAFLGPSLGWVLAALARDIFESGRLSAKFATLLHVHYAVLVYVVLFVFSMIPASLAAYSGAQTSKALR